jgi:hypothetical protein
MRRAVRWDGIIVQAQDESGRPATGPEPLHDVREYVHRERPPDLADRPFDIIVDGSTPADNPDAAAATARAHAEAGATWWTEVDWSDSSVAAMRARIAAGPPRGLA